MKPHRIRVTHDLVTAYGMLDKMHILVKDFLIKVRPMFIELTQKPKRATPEVMSSFHTDEYVHFLHGVTPETAERLTYSGTRCESSDSWRSFDLVFTLSNAVSNCLTISSGRGR